MYFLRSSESVTIVSFDCLQYKVPITPVRIGYNNNHPSYRLRARLLECFYSNQATTISSCYEDALKRDPTCIYTLERLIKMHKTGLPETWILILYKLCLCSYLVLDFSLRLCLVGN